MFYYELAGSRTSKVKFRFCNFGKSFVCPKRGAEFRHSTLIASKFGVKSGERKCLNTKFPGSLSLHCCVWDTAWSSIYPIQGYENIEILWLFLFLSNTYNNQIFNVFTVVKKCWSSILKVFKRFSYFLQVNTHRR